MGIEDTKETTFTCRSCKEEVATIYMGRCQDVCEFCECKSDED